MVQALALALLVALQAAPETTQPPPPAAAKEKEIVVFGEVQKRLWLEGLEAFRAGRYAEAEKKAYALEQRVEGAARFENQNRASFLSSESSLGSRVFADFLFTVDRIPNEGAAVVYLRGIAQARQGKLDAAAGAMKEALRIDAKFFDGYVDLALIQVLRGRPDLARRQLKPMAKLLATCDYNCEEKQARYARVQEAAEGEAG